MGSGADWRERLGREPLPLESGWWRLLTTSGLPVRDGDETVPAHNSIAYLLDAERPINYWHWLASDDTHVLVDGGPAEYVVVDATGAVSRHLLGTDLAAGQQLSVTVPAGCHKAVRLVDPGGFALMISVVTPAWSPTRSRVAPPVVDDAQRPTWLTDVLLAELTSPDVGPAQDHGTR